MLKYKVEKMKMRVAAVVYVMGEAERVDRELSGLADRLRQAGYTLAGAVQHNKAETSSPCSDMVLEDLATGQRLDCRTSMAALPFLVGPGSNSPPIPALRSRAALGGPR